jgi:hypothetical protein
VIYLDTCALAKLVWREPQSDALRSFLAKWPQTPLVSSALPGLGARTAPRGRGAARGRGRCRG